MPNTVHRTVTQAFPILLEHELYWEWGYQLAAIDSLVLLGRIIRLGQAYYNPGFQTLQLKLAPFSSKDSLLQTAIAVCNSLKPAGAVRKKEMSEIR